jgi:hypothetical protein
MGFTAADAALLVPFTERELTVSQLRRAYGQDLITEAELRARLAGLGFAAPSVDLLVALE